MQDVAPGLSQVMDVRTVAGIFPLLPSPLIDRLHVLETIETMFETGAPVVAVEGEEGIGKTTLLAQFALRHPHNAIALFLKPTIGLSSDPWYWQFELCKQVVWILRNDVLDPELQAVDSTLLRILLTQLQTRARLKATHYYFVLDGLEDLAQGESLRKVVLDMLPLGIPGFRFLISGELSNMDIGELGTSKPRAYPITKFSLDETVRYYADLSIGLDQASEIRNICQGIPGRLASVRRILEGGVNIDLLIADAPSQLAELLEYEWSAAIRQAGQQLMMLLAVLAHDQVRHTLDLLAELCECGKDTVLALLAPVRFVQIHPTTGEVSFVSEAFRAFAASHLQEWKTRVTSRIIAYLSDRPDSSVALAHLPTYLAEARQFDTLYSYLSSKHFVQMIQENQSLRPALQSAEIGLTCAYKMKHDGELARLSMSASLLRKQAQIEVARAEVEARTALGDFDAALALAQSSVLKPDRLNLLAIVAKAYVLKKDSPPQELIEQISQLVSELDTADLGDRAVEIAGDLIFSLPEQAIQMVEDANPTPSDMRSAETPLAVFSLQTAVARQILGVETKGSAEAEKRLWSRLKDSPAGGAAEVLAATLGGKSAKEVLATLDSMGQVRDKIFFLRVWSRANCRRSDASEVVEYALKLILSLSDFLPNAGTYRDLAEPIPYIRDATVAKYLIGQLDSQRDLIEQHGPSQDYVRLQLTLAKAEAQFDLPAARNRLLEVYDYAIERPDLAVKAECLAWIISAASEYETIWATSEESTLVSPGDKQGRIEELQRYVRELLAATASHYDITVGIVAALARFAPDQAIGVAGMLNTEARRDLALVDIVERLAKQAKTEVQAVFLQQAISNIQVQNKRDQALRYVLQRISEKAGSKSFHFDSYLWFLQQTEHIGDAAVRCMAYCIAYSALSRRMKAHGNQDRYAGYAFHLLQAMRSTWEVIDVGWIKVDVGYDIVEALSATDEEVAREYLSITDQFRAEIELDSVDTANTFGHSLSLAIRAFAGLLPQRIDSETDFLRLAALIDEIPSYGERATKWADLALLCYARSRQDLAERIVSERIKPLLHDVQGGDTYRSLVVQAVAPALWRFHPDSARTLVQSVPIEHREDVLLEVAQYLLKGLPSREPYSLGPADTGVVPFENLLDLCTIAEQLKTDYSIYWITQLVCSAMGKGRRAGAYRRDQQRTILDRLGNVVSKLPDKKNIQHEGYRVVAEAELMHAESSRYRAEDWHRLVDRARAIPNVSDRAFVLSIVAVLMPSGSAIPRQMLNDAGALVDDIPSEIDRARRPIAMAEVILESDVAEHYAGIARSSLEAAMKSACAGRGGSAYAAQRRIVDIAYSFDESLAESLASQASDDRSHVKERLQLLKTRKAIRTLDASSLVTGGITLSQSEQQLYSRAAWMSLSELATKAKDIARADQIRNVLWMAGHLPLPEAYALVSLAFEHSIARYSRDPQARGILYPQFTAALALAELAQEVSSVANANIRRVKEYVVQVPEPGAGFIPTGSREAAFKYLRAWFEENLREYVKLCDPFFGLEELEWIRLIGDIVPDCVVTVLTSRKHQTQRDVATPWEDTYNMYWRRRISDQDPPDTEIIVVGDQLRGESPIHDRWILTKGAGLVIGPSLNGLGSKDSKITVMTPEEASIAEQTLDQYLTRQKRTHGQQKLQYTSFNLVAAT